MRLLQVTASKGWRGHEQKIIYLYEAFRDYGYVKDQWIVCPTDSQIFQIVGVDEANIAKSKISFISPLAKALLNRKVGDKITLKRDREDIVFEIMDIAYG